MPTSQPKPWNPPSLHTAEEDEGVLSVPTPGEPVEKEGPWEAELAAERERLREQARAEGYSAGHAEGLKAGEQEVQDLVSRLSGMLEQVCAPVSELEGELETAVLGLAVEIARRVVLHEVSVEPERLLGVIRECLRKVPLSHGPLRLRVSSEDKQMLTRSKLKLPASGLQLQVDPDLLRGGCVLEVSEPVAQGVDRDWHPPGSGGGAEVDARLDRRWRQVLAVIFDEALVQ